MADEADDLRDVRAEETGRGKKQPVKADARARERAIRHLSAMLENPRVNFETYLEVIHALGLQAEPEKYQALVELWRARRG